jgi:hypothetical protein
MSSCQALQDAFYKIVLKDVQQVGQVSVDSIGGQVKDFYTLALEDRDALNKHMVCKMQHRGPCSGARDREKECVTLVIATIPSKRGRPPKDPLVFVKLNLTSTMNTPLRRFT